jgi:hypothetical protein
MSISSLDQVEWNLSPTRPTPRTLQKIRDFWTVSNSPEIAKNRLEKSPDCLFYMVSNRP